MLFRSDMLRQQPTPDSEKAIDSSIPAIDINTNISQQQPNIDEQIISIPNINEPQQKTTTLQEPLTINNQQSESQIITIPNETKPESYNQVYDLRFAINNVRQAVQNTEKFGFNIDVQEFDLDNVYQIIIKIDKNKF